MLKNGSTRPPDSVRDPMTQGTHSPSFRYLLLLGSNIDKEIKLPRAEECLSEGNSVIIVARSFIYESEPIGAPDTPRFHNRALLVESTLELDDLRQRFRELESTLGRRRTDDPNAPRPIDIDIVLALDDTNRVRELVARDPDLWRLHHVVFPIAELVGHVRLPDGHRIADLAHSLGAPPAGFHRVAIEASLPPPEFLSHLSELTIPISDAALRKLGHYLSLLLETSRHINLTAIRDPDEAWLRHVLDSVTLYHPLKLVNARTVLDVGSGGGLPGIPLAIITPEVHFTLLEATGKKARFLEAVVRDLQLRNVAVVQERAEVIGRHPEHREGYETVLARAVGHLRVLLELTVPLAAVGGGVLAIKGEKAETEIAEAKGALHLLHAHVVGTERTPTGTIVLIEKTRTTPRKYPRKPGEPKRSPLG